MSQLRTTFASDVCYIVFLCGYFDSGDLDYEAADGIAYDVAFRPDRACLGSGACLTG